MTMEHDGPDPGRSESPDLPTLEELLGGDSGPAASTQNLEGVMRRHLRHRRRWTTGIAAAVLAAGTGGGVVAAELISTGTQAAVGGQSPTTTNNLFGTNATSGTNPGVQPASGQSTFGASRVAAPEGLVWSSGGATAASGGVADNVANGYVSAGGVATSASAPGACTQVGCFHSVYSGSHVTRLFDRSANGIEVRVFEVTFSYSKLNKGVATPPPNQSTSPPASSGGAPGSAPSGSATASSGSTSAGSTSGSPTGAPATPATPVLPACSIPNELIIEVSNAGAVGEFTVPLPSSTSKPVSLAAEEVAGLEEGSPMAVVAVKVAPAVQSVSATFASGAHDSMVVVGGLAVLVAPVASTTSPYTEAAASLVAAGAGGRVLERFAMPGTPSLAEPETCVAVVPGVASGGSAGSSGAPSTSGSSR